MTSAVPSSEPVRWLVAPQGSPSGGFAPSPAGWMVRWRVKAGHQKSSQKTTQFSTAIHIVNTTKKKNWYHLPVLHCFTAYFVLHRPTVHQDMNADSISVATPFPSRLQRGLRLRRACVQQAGVILAIYNFALILRMLPGFCPMISLISVAYSYISEYNEIPAIVTGP